MRSAAVAIGWDFRQRHRWGLTVLGAYFLCLAIIKVFFTAGKGAAFHDAQTFALLVIVPLTATFIYFLAIFSFGLAGDLATRRSMYPARMFTLPVTNDALVAWPMFYGTAAMAVLWFATRLLAVWPAGDDVPRIWPALLAAVLLAWTQALTWMPYPLRGLRVVVTILWLAVIDTVVLVALQFKPREAVMLAILAPQIPLAFFVARFAVAKARRGDDAGWQGIERRRTDIAPSEQPHFRSPARAQLWFEWRRQGRALPALVAILLPFELALLFLLSRTPALVTEILLAVMLTPPFMAAFVAATASRADPSGSDSYTLSSFTAARPLDDLSLIAARLKMTMASTLATWLIVGIAVPIALMLSGTSAEVVTLGRHLVGVFGPVRAIAVLLLALAVLMASTWKQLVQSLFIGMSGREWLVRASLFAALTIIAVAAPAVHWILTNGDVLAAVWNAFPWIAAVLVLAKITAAAWVAVRLHAARIVSDRTLILGAVAWNAVVFGLYGLLVWIFPEVLVRGYVLALVAILEVPLARLSAAPLALAWNRRR